MEKFDQTPGPGTAPRSRRTSTKHAEFILGLFVAIPILVSFSYIQQWAVPKPSLVDDFNPHSPPTTVSHEPANSNPWLSVRPS